MNASTSPHAWLHAVVDAPAVDQLCSALAASPRVAAEGSCGSSTTLLAGALALRTGKPVLLTVGHLDEADDAVEDLELFAAAGYDLPVRRFGAMEVLPGESSVSLELLAERLAVVEWLTGFGPRHPASQAGPPPGPWVLVAPIAALMQSVPRPEALGDFSLTLTAGGAMPPGRLLDWLDRAGYQRADAIEQPGDFTIRGGIIDIYAPSARVALDDKTPHSTAPPPSAEPIPLRLDFFGDEIDTLTLIDTDTMGSGARLRHAQLVGASTAQIQNDDRTTHLPSLLPDDRLVILHELLELSEQARGYYERLTNARGIYSPQAVLKHLSAGAHVLVHQYGCASGDDLRVRLPVHPLPSFDQNAAQAVVELDAMASEPCNRAVALCSNQGERDRLAELLAERDSEARHAVDLQLGYLHRGFVWGDGDEVMDDAASHRVTLVPHHELFHRYHTRRRIRRVSTAVDRASDAFVDLEVGDHVVHVDHGIARFVGLRTMRRQNVTEEYLTLEFAQGAKLHVPATQIDLVQKYIGGFHGKPPLSILGGKRWARQKQQVAEAVKDMAAELLRVQAARASMPGVRYPVDTPWQKEFEAEFPYEETDDQLAAIAAVKKDMADEQPMDRLICGDVGFGKTEVAIRAAFKAAEAGKQVAVLVPTTVLAEQHERTFRGRMADYPFRVASISRFKTAGEQKKLLDQLAAGQVDIIIGTHRLLSADVKFADLGMVIIDEEQRFGVEHKQRLLQFRLTADVLTLTATPIPRTLHMSMLGLRDISSLATPPLDRRAIVTEVIPFDKRRVQQALIRELSREGQVFFVHNRVYNIHTVADEIRQLVPSARVIVGHGQMAGHELEAVMLKFLRREADILVSTTIIESGLDIPTANTMFINEADHFGLADLHQLRGRVGRYKHRAYCYLLLPADRPITDTGARRLKAIEQFSMLGAGFKIAMRDLEIRGAGNILGKEQSGHIAAVGYEMYCKLLEQEARRLQHAESIEPVKTHLELPLPGGAGGLRIPPQYVPSEKHRMEAYKRISRCLSLDQLDEVVEDLRQAYGDPPPAAAALIEMAELRIAASMLGVRTVRLDGPDVIFRLDPSAKAARLQTTLEGVAGRVSLIDDLTVYYRPPANYLESPDTLLAVLRQRLVAPLREAAVHA